jgi:hypothetical protein
LAENHWRTFGENAWRSVGENTWRTFGENLWRIIARKLTAQILIEGQNVIVQHCYRCFGLFRSV